MPLGWGIVGPGGIADREMAPAIAADANSELVAVVARDQEKGRAFADKHGVAWSSTSYDDLLARPDVDVVLVTTPNALHPDQVIAAARAGKHVLCDKPLALNTADGERVIAACAGAGVRLGMNFQTRYHACFQEARTIIQSGEIGRVSHIQVDASPGTRRPAGWRTDLDVAGLGSVNNIAVHMYDLLRFLLDQEVTEVSAMFDVGRQHAMEVLPLVLLRFDGGALAYANGNQSSFRPLNEIVVYGDRGRLDGQGLTRPETEGDLRVVTEAGERATHHAGADCYRRLVAAFSDAVVHDRDPSPSGEDGLRSVQLTDAIARSAREGRVVEVGTSSRPLTA
ncbi:MAG: Gfo/Idh/MocA family protein [Candidatus Dormibacteria bacterium]